MGCTSSNAKVDPTGGKASPSKDTSNNQLRGDRLSMVDARQKREDDNRERRRRLSSLVPNQVNIATSRNSSKRGSLALVEENKKLSETSDGQNDKNHTKNKDVAKKISNGQHKHEKSNIISNSDENDANRNKSKLSQEDFKNQKNNVRTEKVSEDSRMIYVGPVSDSPRMSVDSVVLKNNANAFVNNIMANALTQVEDDKITNKHVIDKTTSNTSLRTNSPVNTARSNGSTNMEVQAKDIVGNVLNQALVQLTNENASSEDR